MRRDRTRIRYKGSVVSIAALCAAASHLPENVIGLVVGSVRRRVSIRHVEVHNSWHRRFEEVKRATYTVVEATPEALL